MDKATIGHNVGDPYLRSIVERIENVETEIKERTEDRKEIYSEAKAKGYDPKIIRKLVAERKVDEAKRQEEEALLETYRAALGPLSDLPLGAAAMRGVGG